MLTLFLGSTCGSKAAPNAASGSKLRPRLCCCSSCKTVTPRFQVCRPQRPACRGLERLLQEFSHQGHTLSRVCREKAVLVQENAALEAQLAAKERDVRGLSEQLVEAR